MVLVSSYRNDEADSLDESQANREVTRVLVDLLLTGLPSFISASNLGRTIVSNCMMMEAVIYGMMPMANMAI